MHVQSGLDLVFIAQILNQNCLKILTSSNMDNKIILKLKFYHTIKNNDVKVKMSKNFFRFLFS